MHFLFLFFSYVLQILLEHAIDPPERRQHRHRVRETTRTRARHLPTVFRNAHEVIHSRFASQNHQHRCQIFTNSEVMHKLRNTICNLAGLLAAAVTHVQALTPTH